MRRRRLGCLREQDFRKALKTAGIAIAATLMVDVFSGTANAQCEVGPLIEAINDANNGGSGNNTITLFPGCTYTLTGLTGPLPAIASKIRIRGNGATIDGNFMYWGFRVEATGDLELNDLTITRSSWDGYIEGIAIGNFGMLTVRNSAITGNEANHVSGGVLYNEGTATIVGSSITHNSAGDGIGGGIVNEGGVLTVRDSAISHNQVFYGLGAGISNSGTLTVMRSSISGNVGFGSGGGGLSNSGFTTITQSTIADNEASWGATIQDGSGGGIWNTGTLTLRNSSVTGNTTPNSGGGVYNFGGSLILSGQTNITENIADHDGDDVYNNGTITVRGPAVIGMCDEIGSGTGCP